MSKSDKYFLGNILFVDFAKFYKKYIWMMDFSEIIRIFVPDIHICNLYNNHYYYANWYNYNPCCYCRILCGW